MAHQNARLTFLRLVADHDGEWGWYQFERAFPPGWFADELPETTAKSILDRLKRDGLVTTTPNDPHGKYRLTEQGLAVLREANLSSASA